MTVVRGLFVIMLLVVVGVAIVALRGESARAANRIQRLHHQKVALEHKRWAQEMELAKLRGPEAIRQRASELGLDLLPPVIETGPSQPEAGQ